MPRISTLLIAVLAALFTSACTAGKSTYHLIQGDQALFNAEQVGAPKHAVYYWTLADEYQKKAREEWGYADYGPAEDLTLKAAEAAAKAAEAAAKAAKDASVEEAPELVPEEVDRGEEDGDEGIRGRDERLDLDDLDLDGEE